MNEEPQTRQVSATFEEIALYNMLLVESLIELLVEKGVVDGDEIKERAKRMCGCSSAHNSI